MTIHRTLAKALLVAGEIGLGYLGISSLASKGKDKFESNSVHEVSTNSGSTVFKMQNGICIEFNTFKYAMKDGQLMRCSKYNDNDVWTAVKFKLSYGVEI
jgi:hypothetical protein